MSAAIAAIRSARQKSVTLSDLLASTSAVVRALVLAFTCAIDSFLLERRP
jgi:hypothetical protein